MLRFLDERSLRGLGSAVALSAVVFLAGCSNEEAPLPPVVDRETARTVVQGEIIGYTTPEGAYAWLGVPFAAAPVGDLRWRAPRPPEAWEGVRESLTFQDRCPQITNALDAGEGVDPGQLLGSEDCLYLNVYAPPGALDGDEPLPVMLWIHGGGNVWGHAGQYDGSVLAVRQNVIVVTIQYRLGPLGWFAHEGLRATAETMEDTGANFAIQDMIASLEWVRDNIAVFGGDGDRVTIFGESAGGHDVAALLAAEDARGLFHRAIVQSGNFETVPVELAENGGQGAQAVINSARAVAERWFEAAGQDGGSLTPQAQGTFFRGLSVEDVFAAYRDGGNAGLTSLPRIIADGVVLPRDGILAALADPARTTDVPVILGTTRDETKLFNFLNPEYVSNFLGLIYWAKDEPFYDAVSDYQSMAWRVRGIETPADAMISAGHDEVYAYRFDWDEEGSVLFSDFTQLLGAAHSFEIPFVFGETRFLGQLGDLIFHSGNAPGREALTAAMMDYWGAFAHNGDPGQGRDLARPVWSKRDGVGGPAFMVFDTPADGGVRMQEGTLDLAGIVERLSNDPRLEGDERVCEGFRALVAWTPDAAEHTNFVRDGACSLTE